MNFYDDPRHVEEYIEMCKDYDGGDLVDAVRRHLPEGSSVLELGSGSGNDAALLAERYELTVSDKSPAFLAHLKRRFPKLKALELDCRSAPPAYFDAIYSNKVLHHLRDEELRASIQGQLTCLNPHGLLFHSFWKGSKEEEAHGLFFNFHTRDALEALIGDFCTIYDYWEYEEMEEGDSFFIVLGSFA